MKRDVFDLYRRNGRLIYRKLLEFVPIWFSVLFSIQPSATRLASATEVFSATLPPDTPMLQDGMVFRLSRIRSGRR